MAPCEALELAKEGRVRAAEESLMAALDDPQADVRDWPAVVETIVKAADAESAEPLAWTTLDAIQARCQPREAIPHCGKILKLFSKSQEFRDRAVTLYQEAFAEVQSIDRLIEVSGLKGGKPVRRALQTLDVCLGLQPGSFLVHKDEGPAARVVAIEHDSWSVRIETPAGEELYDPVSLGDHFEIGEAHDFRVLQQFNPEGFAQQLKNRPEAIVATMIRANNNTLTSDELELHLTPQPIARSEWSKWWTRTRARLKKDPHIRMSGRNPVVITYEEQAASVEDELWAKFDVHAEPKVWLELGQEYLREAKNRGLQLQPEFLLKLRDAVRVEAAALAERQDPETLNAWLTISELSHIAGQEREESEALRLLAECPSLTAEFRRLSGETYWTIALDCLRRARPDDWPDVLIELLPIAAPSRSDALVREITAAGKEHLLDHLVADILSDPVMNANGLCWLYQGPESAERLQIPPLTTLLTRMFEVLHQVRSAATIPADVAREVRARIRSTLVAKKCLRFRECLEHIDAGMADTLRTQLQRAQGLSESAVSELMRCIRTAFQQLWSKPEKPRWEDEEVLYCTDSGYHKKESELNELVNVRLKENAIAIGRAAEHGDLSENSEYKFALEERDLLHSRIAEIQNQMARARVLRGEEVPRDHVTVGSKVALRHRPTHQCMTLSFLGPWEADVEGNILNYQAPMSQRLMGLKIGDSIDLEFKGLSGEFEVLSIDSAI